MSYVAPDFGEQSRCGHVTRISFPTLGNFRSFEPSNSDVLRVNYLCQSVPVSSVLAQHEQSIGHVDWLTMKQSHDADLPVLANGCVMSFDVDGSVEYTTLKTFEVLGSFDSKCYVRCDGHTVQFSGNPSRWGRKDNVFGYGFGQCLHVVNDIVMSVGLPPFTAGRSTETIGKTGVVSRIWTGATISRLDITENYITGSSDDAHHFLRWLAGQKLAQKKTSFYGDHSTVDFGRGSKRNYFKVYNKGIELLKHSKSKSESDDIFKHGRDVHIDKLANWCNENGLVRAELELKYLSLFDLKCHFLGDLNMSVIEAEFRKHTVVFERSNKDAEIDVMSDLDHKTLSIYRMWQAGDFVKGKFSKSALYRFRSKLLPYGVDILIPNNVSRLEPKIRVIRLATAVMPDWYDLPTIVPKFRMVA